jgi:ABC-2 type transport system permease protein
MLPSTWVARGIERTLRHDHLRALGYLTVTAANALFASWLAVVLCARGYARAYDLSSTGQGRTRRTNAARGPKTEGFCERVFFYLPVHLRLLAAKDLRTFMRDPLQWSQLAILFGLMGLYLINLPRFYADLLHTSWGALVPFLNLCAVTLILATFTSRFVFPLISLEGHQLWLIGLLPVPRRRILLAKFAYALTITSFASVTVTALAAASLRMSPGWALLNVAVVLGVCVGLCGLAVGLGARMPLFGQLNAGRIANGVGGTINLVASVALVVAVLTGMALVATHARPLGPTKPPDLISVGMVLAIAALPVVAGLVALHIGSRHFERLDI